MNPQEPYSVPTGVVPRLNREIVAEVQKHIDRLAPMIEDTTRVAPMMETDGPYGGAVIVSPISQREAVDTLVALAAAVDPVAKAGCPTCGDSLQAVSCYVPDHGKQRLLTMDFCMDCGAPKRFSISDPAPPRAADQAVNDYLLMERKARAWDELRLAATRGGERLGTAAEVLAFMDRLVHPAQDDKA